MAYNNYQNPNYVSAGLSGYQSYKGNGRGLKNKNGPGPSGGTPSFSSASSSSASNKSKRASFSGSGSGSVGSAGSLSHRFENAEESKDRQVEAVEPEVFALSGRELLVKLGRLLDKPKSKKFIWWKDSRSGKCLGGHRVCFSQSKALVRGVDGKYTIQLKSSLLDEPPRDVTAADATTIINRLSFLLRDFETTAEVQETERGWVSTRSVVRTVVVTRYGLPGTRGSQRVGIAWSPYGALKWIDVSELRSVENGEVNAVEESLREQLARVEGELRDAGVEKTTLRRDLQEVQSDRNQARSELGDAKKKVGRLTEENRTKTSRIQTLEQEKSRLTNSKRAVENDLKKKISTLETRARAEGRKYRDEIGRRDAEITSLERTKASNEETIRLWSKKFSDLKVDKQELQTSLNEQLAQVRHYKANEEAYERQGEYYVAEMKKNESLVADNARLHAQLSQYRGHNLDSIFREINFVRELANLCSEQHDSALDACELSRLSDEQSFALLWRVFMFCYSYFEGRIQDIRRMLNMGASDALERLFMARMQENYKVIMDLSGLVDAFSQEFEGEMGSLVSEARMVSYVRGCGELCWCVVLASSPSLEFRPRVDDIVVSGGEVAVAFDPTKFLDHTGELGGNGGVVDQYVLPGLYRVDTNAAVALPRVRAHNVRAISRFRESKAEKPNSRVGAQGQGLELENMREKLEPIEAVIVGCRSYKVRQMLKQVGINLQKADISIGCAEDDCDYVFAANFKEYTRLSRNCDRLVCGNNEDHVGAKIISVTSS